MLLKIYTVYDSKTESYLKPFFLLSPGEALRGFIDIANDKNTAIGLHPEDYTLFELGEWEDSHATFEMHSTPISLGVALEFLKTQVPEEQGKLL